jgi:hypothetical protein
MFTIADKDRLVVLCRCYKPVFGQCFSATGDYVALSGLLYYSSTPGPGLHPGLYFSALQAFFLQNTLKFKQLGMLRKA